MLGEVVREAARRFGDRSAFVADAGWWLSYADLDRLSDEVAGGLAQRGVGPGDVVAVALPTVPDNPVAYIAAAKLGAVTAGINARLTEPERAALLAVAQPTLVLATEDLAPSDGSPWPIELVDPAPGPDDMLRSLRRAGGAGGPSAPPAHHAHDDDPVALVFTSGTTGDPKAALYCNRQLRAITAVDVGDVWGGGAPMLVATPPAHLGFVTKLPGHLRRGATMFLRLRWRAGDALRLAAEHGMPVVNGIPTQVALMLRHPDVDRYDLSAVQVVAMGGGPVTGALVREAGERFGAPVVNFYNCTEAGLGTGTVVGDPPEDAAETVGRPRPGVELVVLGAGGERLPVGGVGEVCLRSAAMMSGYWRDPEATAAVFTPDGFLRTGDVGWVDERGRLHLVGRSKEMYVRGGYNVYPVEVEAVLATHPDVAAVAVVPRSDPVMGEIGVAAVVPRPGVTAPPLSDLRRHAASRLAHHKLPEDLLQLDELPLTPVEKVDRRALAELVRRSSAAPPDQDRTRVT